MSVLEDIAAIRDQFFDNWPDTVQTLYENAPLADMSEDDYYVRFSILPGTTKPISTGPDCLVSGIGHVRLQVFVPKNAGTRDGYALAAQFADLFRRWRSSDGAITFKTETMGGSDKDPSGCYTITVVVFYESIRRL